jgi:ribose transport system substrate-binding protein
MTHFPSQGQPPSSICKESQLKQRTPIAVAATLALLLSVSSFGSASATAATKLHPIKSMFFSNVLPSYPPLAEANRCFLAEAKKLGIRAATAGPAGSSVDNQFNIDRMQQAVANKYDAILSQPIDKALFTPVMNLAKSKGIYQATINTGDTTSVQDFTVGTDYKIQGATVAKAISLRPGNQFVGIIGGAPTGTNNVFVDGFKKGISSQSLSNVHYVLNAFDAGDPSKTTDVVNQMLTAHPEINVVLSWQGSSAPGIITAIKEKNAIGKIVGVTNDITDQVSQGIKDGVIYGTSKQDFCKMTTVAVDLLVKLSKGKKVPKAVDSGIIFVTKDNLAKESK